MTPEQVDVIAQGRVWSGADAHAAGLVDQLGGLSDAIASAAKRADLGDTYQIEYVDRDLGLPERIAKELMGAEAPYVGFLPSLAGTPYAKVLREIDEHARVLASFNDPHGIYAYAMIDVD